MVSVARKYSRVRRSSGDGSRPVDSLDIPDGVPMKPKKPVVKKSSDVWWYICLALVAGVIGYEFGILPEPTQQTNVATARFPSYVFNEGVGDTKWADPTEPWKSKCQDAWRILQNPKTSKERMAFAILDQ